MRVTRDAVPNASMHIEAFVAHPNFYNAHAVDVAAGADRTWRAVRTVAGDLRPRGPAAVPLALASLLRRDVRDGVPLTIAHMDEEREIVITGHHRFADFATNIYLEPLPDDRTRIYNVTRARFAGGAIGWVYRRGVDVFHDAYVAAVLRRIKRLAEAP
jgi:hypothetical protein